MDKIDTGMDKLQDLLNSMNNGSKIVIKKVDNKYIVITSIISEIYLDDIVK